ncbi:MAG: hypothetical protein JEY71_15160 [Sphaerochaeta sp.]|nr:hypothetical protein [Sphaerochaeta sp.]
MLAGFEEAKCKNAICEPAEMMTDVTTNTTKGFCPLVYLSRKSGYSQAASAKHHLPLLKNKNTAPKNTINPV